MTERSCGFDSHRGHSRIVGGSADGYLGVRVPDPGCAFGDAMRHGFSRLVRLGLLCTCVLITPAAHAALRAGAYAQDITPETFPVIVNGNFTEVVAMKANDWLHARALVLDDGATTVAIVVVDSCMLPRELLDEAKARA